MPMPTCHELRLWGFEGSTSLFHSHLTLICAKLNDMEYGLGDVCRMFLATMCFFIRICRFYKLYIGVTDHLHHMAPTRGSGPHTASGLG